MSLRTAARYIALTFELKKNSLLSEMEYRVSFWFQMIGMVINDLGYLAVWLIIFYRFPNLNGWTSNEFILLEAITTLTWGMIYFFTEGVDHISLHITEGKLDQLMVLPKNILWQISVSDTYVTSIGDMFFGLALFFFAKEASLPNFFIFLVVSILAAVIAYSFVVIAHTFSFYFGNFNQGAWSLVNAFGHLTDTPQSIYRGGLKFVSMFVLPAFFVGMVPVSIIQHFSLKEMGALLLASLIILTLAIKFFNAGLRRYESGNLINLNV